jgi:hypothetical protein
MLGIRLEPDLEARLERLARRTGQTKSFHAREAIKQYLDAHRPGHKNEDREAFVARLMAIGTRHTALPLLDIRSDEEILGYDEMTDPRSE